MRDRETYDNYLDIPVSPEVREFLEENARELKRQRDHAYQYGVSCHARDTDKQNKIDTDSALCDMVYLDTEVHSDSAEKVFFRQEAKIALIRALLGLSDSARRRLLLHFVDELSFTEIARREGVTEGAVRGQIKIALIRLRRELEDQDIRASDFRYRSPHDYQPALTRNGQKQRDKKKDQKRDLAQGSGDRDVA